MRASLRDRWNAFWFEPSDPLGLATCRALFYGTFLLYFLRIDYQELASVPQFAWNPIWPFGAISFYVPSAATLNMLQWIWRAALFGACLGFAWRWTSTAAFILGFYLIGLSECVARINHSDAIVVFGLAVFAMSRGADALSIDPMARWTARHAVEPSGEYTWPIRTMWVVVVTIYFAAGVTKLMTSGFVWVASDNLSNLLMLGPVTGSPLTSLGQQIGRYRGVSSALAAASLAIELSVPLALMSRSARRVLIPMLFGMQFCIRWLMGPGFTEFFICGLFWIPWGDVRRLRGRPSPLPGASAGPGPATAPAVTAGSHHLA